MSPNRTYAKLADLWQQDCRVEMAKYKFAAGATASFRRLSPVMPFYRGCVKTQVRDRRMVGWLAVSDCRISTDLLRSMSF